MSTSFNVRHVTALTGVLAPTLDYWARTGVATPSVDMGRGRSRGKQYTFTELVGVRAIARLRKQDVSLQAVRKILPLLRELTGGGSNLEAFAGARLVALGDDVALAKSPEALVSLLTTPGQGLMTPVLLDVGDEVRDVQHNMEQRAASDKHLAAVVTEMKREGAWLKRVA